MFNIHFDTAFNSVTEADFPNFVTPLRLPFQTALEAIDFTTLTVIGVSQVGMILENADYKLTFTTTNLEPTSSLAGFQDALNNLLITGGVRTLEVVQKPSTEIMNITFFSNEMTIVSGTQTLTIQGAVFSDFENFILGRDAFLSLFGAPGSGSYSPGEALSYLSALEFGTITLEDSALSGSIIQIEGDSQLFRVISHGYTLEATGDNVSISNMERLADTLFRADLNTTFQRDVFFDTHEFKTIKFTDPSGTVLFSLDGDFIYDDFANIVPVLGTATGDAIGNSADTAAQYLYAGAGADTVSGGAGDDHLTGGNGADTLFGGGGTDIAHYDLAGSFDNASGVTVAFGAGTVTDSFGVVDQLNGIEQIDGSAFNDVFYSGGPVSVFRGRAGDDALYGGGLGDQLYGGAGVDRIVGNAGNDSLFGGDGADTLNGGGGDDVIYGGDTNADLRDTVFAGAGNDTVDGGYGNDLIYGQEGNDRLAGGFGSDTLQGQGGDDVITGSALSDLVFGNEGNDFVNGGFGHDRINGGTGADKFYHLGVKDHGGDWIQDFNSTEGDVLVFGTPGATKDDFQINYSDSGSGDTSVDEAFIIYKPRALQAGDNGIVWALVDGEALTTLTVEVAGGGSFDLLA